MFEGWREAWKGRQHLFVGTIFGEASVGLFSVCCGSDGEEREGTTDCNEEENCCRSLEKGGDICLCA